MLLQPLPKILINSKPLARRMGDAVKYPGANPVPHLDKEQGRFGPNGSLRQVQPAVVNEHRPQHHGPRDPPSPPAGKTGLCFPAMQHWARELSAGRLGEEEEQEFSPLPASASIPDQSRDGDISLWQIQARTVGREVPTAPRGSWTTGQGSAPLQQAVTANLSQPCQAPRSCRAGKGIALECRGAQAQL